MSLLNDPSQVAVVRFPVLQVLGLIFITLKLTGHIAHWHWVWVLSPFMVLLVIQILNALPSGKN